MAKSPAKDGQIDEGIIVRSRQFVTFKSGDEELLKAANAWRDDGKALYDKMCVLGKKNRDYWKGDQLDEKKLDEYQAKAVVNKVFQNMETMVPVAAANLPAPVTTLPDSDVPGEDIDNRTEGMDIEEIILGIAQEGKLGKELKKFCRNHQLDHLGVLRYWYDKDTKQIKFKVERAKDILVPDNDYDEWVIQMHKKTWADFQKEFFGDDDAGKTKFINDVMAGDKGELKSDSVIAYLEVVLPDFTFWKVDNVVFKKEKNVNWDWENEKVNYWLKPQINYIFSDMWRLDENRYSSSTLVSQTLSIQDLINKRKRQISDSATDANGVMVGYGDSGVTKEEVVSVQTARAKPKGVAFVEKGSPGSFHHFTGRPLDSFVFDDLSHSILEMDNIWGTHANLRGERTPGEETFGGRKLLRGADETRLGEIGAMLDDVAEELYRGVAQLIRVHFKKAHYVSFLGVDGATKLMKIDSKIIQDGVRISVQTGSTLKKDKDALARQAIELYDRKAIDLQTLHERLEDPNPLKVVERTVRQLVDPMSLVPQVKKEYDESIKGERMIEVMTAVTQADIENRFLVQGVAVPPYEKANIQHVVAHAELMSSPNFAQLPPEVRTNAIAHVRAEAELVQQLLAGQKDADKQERVDMMDRLTAMAGNLPQLSAPSGVPGGQAPPAPAQQPVQ